MPDPFCLDDICLQSGHWIFVVVGAVALGVAGLIALQRALAFLASAMQSLASFFGSLIQMLGFLLVAGFCGFLLWCAATGTWQHIGIP
jgi:predicted tellurium resistance membrane protein TerC